MPSIALLMKEHRVIERMIKLADAQLERLKQGKTPDLNFIDSAVDFMKTYADRCHHGKEEDILFKRLAQKPLLEEHGKIMQELIQEHFFGRKNTIALVEARMRYAEGDALDGIIENLEKLVKFYPLHIEKEDKRFFIPCMEYFDQNEKAEILKEFLDFDKKLIHEKYSNLVESLEKKLG
jgi:hemerythrin-like domain-containing protein